MMAAQFLLFDPAPRALDFTFSLSLAGMSALSAVIDAMRAAIFQSTLKREVNGVPHLTADQIHQHHSLGFAYNDNRWLVTLLRLLSPLPFPLPADQLQEGMRELVEVGLLRQQNLFQLSPQLAMMTAHLRTPLPACGVESVINQNGQTTHYSYRLYLRGDGPIWQLDYQIENFESQPTIRCQMVDESAVLSGLEQVLKQPAKLGERMPATQLKFCTQCGQKIEGNNKFCVHCGTANS